MPVDDTFNPPPGYTGPPATSGEGTPPDPAQWATDQWWTTPDLAFSAGNTAAGPGRFRDQPLEVALPPWAGGPGGFVDPRTFYNSYWEQPADMRNTWLAQQESAGSARQGIRDDQAAALANIQQQIEWVRSQQAGWQADPNRAAVLGGFNALATSDRPVISERGEAAYTNAIAQEVARNIAASQTRSAGRGTASGGAAGGVQAGIRSAGQAGALQLGANIDIANAEGRNRALNALSTATGNFERLDQSYDNATTALATYAANIQQNVQYEPTDHLAFSQLAFQREAYDQALASSQEAYDAWAKSQELDWMDGLDMILRTVGVALA